MASESKHVVVIGAGVIGLTCAYLLQLHGYQPTVIAEFWPEDTDLNYASPWAGAHYRPAPATNEQEHREQAFCRRTWQWLKKIAADVPESGVKFMTGIEYLSSPPPAYADPALREAGGYSASILSGFRVLDKEELPEGVHLGFIYDAWSLNSPHYIGWLWRQLESEGAQKIKYRLSALPEALYVAEHHFRVKPVGVVNCSGGLSSLGDASCFPRRGQTVLVSKTFDRTITKQYADGTWSFMIPRPCGGGCVVGGTKQSYDWNPYPDPVTTARLLENARALAPDFLADGETPEIRREIVGRRPMRVGGMRIEREALEVNGNTVWLIHAYGAGGSGFEMSFGVAEEVLELIGDDVPMP